MVNKDDAYLVIIDYTWDESGKPAFKDKYQQIDCLSRGSPINLSKRGEAELAEDLSFKPFQRGLSIFGTSRKTPFI